MRLRPILICSHCGKIIEFEYPDIEKLPGEMAVRYGFVVQHNRLELYGACVEHLWSTCVDCNGQIEGEYCEFETYSHL